MMQGARAASGRTKTVRIALLSVLLAPALLLAPSEALSARVKLRGLGGAAGAAAGAVSGSGPADLSYAQLRTCLGLEDTNNKDSDAFDAKKVKMDAESARIDALEADLKKRKATVDTTSQEAVDRYNASAAAYRKRVQAFNKEVDQQKAVGDGFSARVAKFNAECAKKTYRDADYKAASADLAKANAVVQAASEKKGAPAK